MKHFEIGNEQYKVGRKQITANAGGMGISDAAEMVGLAMVPFYSVCVEHTKYGPHTRNVDLYENTSGEVFCVENFSHHNGHFSGFREGVYEVTFKRLIKQ